MCNKFPCPTYDPFKFSSAIDRFFSYSVGLSIDGALRSTTRQIRGNSTLIPIAVNKSKSLIVPEETSNSIISFFCLAIFRFAELFKADRKRRRIYSMIIASSSSS